MKDIWVLRDLFFDQQASLGTFYVYDGRKQIFKKESLERGWVNNQNRTSCLPELDTTIVLEYSDKFNTELWELKDTGPRSECKVHWANFWYELNGCIGIGNNRKKIDGDPIMDITSSRNAVREFHEIMGNDRIARIHIRNVPDLPLL